MEEISTLLFLQLITFKMTCLYLNKRGTIKPTMSRNDYLEG